MADKQPYHVRVVGVDGPNGFVEGLESLAQAEASAKARNQSAEAMGIKARYEAVEAS